MRKNAFICRACGQKFGGASGFDAHRIGKFRDKHPHYGRECRGADAMRKLGYELHGDVWIKPMPENVFNRWA